MPGWPNIVFRIVFRTVFRIDTGYEIRFMVSGLASPTVIWMVVSEANACQTAMHRARLPLVVSRAPPNRADPPRLLAEQGVHLGQRLALTFTALRPPTGAGGWDAQRHPRTGRAGA